MCTIIVGSTNPIKIEATRIGFKRVFPNQIIDIKGTNAPSEVSDQPMSDAESIKGARNRISHIYKTHSPDFAVGIEGGMQQIGNNWFDCGWVVIRNKSGIEGIGSSLRMEVPPKMLSMIREGKELGEVCDYFFRTDNSKHDLGHFGLMTNSQLTRQSAYIDGVISALVRFINKNLF